MVRALVTGGFYDAGGDGVVWHVDFKEERCEEFLRWEPPAHLRVARKGFAGASLDSDGTLFVAAHAAVVRIDVGRASVSGVLHQPSMNDLHHVGLDGDRLLVANTGLSAVDVIDRGGEFLGSYSLLPTWANVRRFEGESLPSEPRDVTVSAWTGAPPTPWLDGDTEVEAYYSRHRRTRPFHEQKVRDHLHVNHAVSTRGRIVATCFADGSLRDLARFEVLWQMPGAYLHDGVVDGGGLWISAIDGTLLELDEITLEERRRLSVFESGHAGWCRGLALTDSHILVGLTEVRADRLPKHRWADREPDGTETSVLLLDRADGRLLARVDLTDLARHSKIYGILLVEGD